MHKQILTLIISVLLFSCGLSKEDKLEAQTWQTVMEQHDVVMPLMSDIGKVRKNLKNLVKTKEGLSNTDSTTIQSLIDNLDKADEGMMDWMNGIQQLGKLQKEKSHTEIISYLERQNQLIEKVGKDMKGSIKAGKDFLENFNE